jgi:UV-endonuclease UvdE
MYRLPTTLAPYASHPELTQFHSQIEKCASGLAGVGALARERDVRLSTHPGQYTVLNSERVEVRAAAVAELESQAALLDAMEPASGSRTTTAASCSPMNSPAGLNSEIRSSRWSTIQTWPSSPKLAAEIISADRSGVRVARACWTRRACLRFCWRAL